MRREVPKLALAWTDGLKTKRYGTKRAAYYAIAKRLVVAKYPAWLSEVWDGMRGMRDDGWSDELVERRTEKMLKLFYRHDSRGLALHFEDRFWRAFVSRVARFLMFVDSKRTTAELLELRFGRVDDAKRLQAEYEAAERAAMSFGEYAREIRNYIDARSKR